MQFVDSLKREISVDLRTWQGKIIWNHPELADNERAIEQTLADPDVRTRDKDYNDREIYYRRGVLETPFHQDFLKVVVAFGLNAGGKLSGRIVTAFAIDRIPRTEMRIWTRPRFNKP